MLRCLQLAKNGKGNVAPNPLVGCVVVYENKIIGEGFHQKYGEHHAEVNAINSVKNKKLLPKSTLYVNLEPCAHTGKTPPCSDLIIKHNIKKVVIGCVDSYAEVAGKGIARLKNAGIEVVVGVLEQESLALNKPFFTFHQKKRPFVILKWAQTKDGFIDVDRSQENSTSSWITSSLSKKVVHKWRSEEAAIMVGTNTALNDNPQLNVREWNGNNPIRIVLDLNLRLPTSLFLFDKTIPTLVFNYQLDKTEQKLTYIKLDKTKNLLTECLGALYKRNIQSVIVEGGTTLLHTFIAANCWDEVRIFTGNKFFEKGLKAPFFKHKPTFKEQIGADELCFYVNE